MPQKCVTRRRSIIRDEFKGGRKPVASVSYFSAASHPLDRTHSRRCENHGKVAIGSRVWVPVQSSFDQSSLEMTDDCVDNDRPAFSDSVSDHSTDVEDKSILWSHRDVLDAQCSLSSPPFSIETPAVSKARFELQSSLLSKSFSAQKAFYGNDHSNADHSDNMLPQRDRHAHHQEHSCHYHHQKRSSQNGDDDLHFQHHDSNQPVSLEGGVQISSLSSSSPVLSPVLCIPPQVLNQMLQSHGRYSIQLVSKYRGSNFYFGIPYLRRQTLHWIWGAAVLMLLSLPAECAKFALSVDNISLFMTICCMPASVLNAFIGYLALRRASYYTVVIYACAEAFLSVLDIILLVSYTVSSRRGETSRILHYGLTGCGFLLTCCCVLVALKACHHARRDVNELALLFPVEHVEDTLDPHPFLIWYFGFPRPVDAMQVH